MTKGETKVKEANDTTSILIGALFEAVRIIRRLEKENAKLRKEIRWTTKALNRFSERLENPKWLL